MDKNEKVNEIVGNLENKDFNIYFYTLDTKGNPKASIANIYDMALNLIELGYKANILHEKNDYLENHPYGWLGDKYKDIPHISLESGGPNIKPEDFVIVPEIFANVMKTMREKNFPSKNIVLCQTPDYIFELLPFNESWGVYNFNDVITTSENNSDYIKSVFPSVKSHIIPPVISEQFKTSGKLKKPIVSLHTRDQSDVAKIVKSFYLQYPVLRWVSFRDLRGVSREEFAEIIDESCLSVWVDDEASFGTFPLESIECETPVIIKVPNNVPSWAIETDENDNSKLKDIAMWCSNTRDIPELINRFLLAYLEDSIGDEIVENMRKEKGKFNNETQKNKLDEVFTSLVEERVKEFKTLITA